MYEPKQYARKTPPEQYLAPKQAEYQKSQRKALGDYSNKYNIDYQTEQQKLPDKYIQEYRDIKKITTPSKTPLDKENYMSYKPSVK